MRFDLRISNYCLVVLLALALTAKSGHALMSAESYGVQRSIEEGIVEQVRANDPLATVSVTIKPRVESREAAVELNAADVLIHIRARNFPNPENVLRSVKALTLEYAMNPELRVEILPSNLVDTTSPRASYEALYGVQEFMLRNKWLILMGIAVLGLGFELLMKFGVKVRERLQRSAAQTNAITSTTGPGRMGSAQRVRVLETADLSWLARLPDEVVVEVLKSFTARQLAEAWIGPEETLQRLARCLPAQKYRLLRTYQKAVRANRDSEAFLRLYKVGRRLAEKIAHS